MPFLLDSCGYLENDGMKDRKDIVGHINLQQYRGSDQIDLVFDGANGISAVVVSDCKAVYYDSMQNMIYAESLITEASSSYYRIIIKNPLSGQLWDAYKKDIIDKRTFEKEISSKGSREIKFE